MSDDDLIRRGDAVKAARSLFRLQTSGLYGAANVADYGLLTDTAEQAIAALPATMRAEVERLREGCPQPCMCPSCWEGEGQ